MDSEEKKLKLEILKDIHRHIIDLSRHTETAWWAVAAILIPITAGGFLVAFQVNPDNSNFKYPPSFQLATGVCSIVIWWLYICFTKNAMLKSKGWEEQAKEIEKELNFKFISGDGELESEDAKLKAEARQKKKAKEIVWINNLYDDTPLFPLNGLFTSLPSGMRFDVFVTFIALLITIVWVWFFLSNFHSEIFNWMDHVSTCLCT